MIVKSGVKSLKLELDNNVSQSYIRYIFFIRSFGRRERLIKHLKSHGIGMMTSARPQYQQPKKIEFKKEPEFNTGLMIDHQIVPSL